MREVINRWDTELFLWLNGWHTPALDAVMQWVTETSSWIPFYALIVGFLAWRYRWQSVPVVVAIALMVTLADQTASSLFKPFFARSRPCYERAIQTLVHVVDGCGGRYGFVSSHAANSFGLAMFLWLLLRTTYPAVSWLFLWAAVVSYSRIYVGVHYPLDILGGALVGIASALLLFYLYRTWVNRKSVIRRSRSSGEPAA